MPLFIPPSQPFKKVETFLCLWTVQKQVLGSMWPVGCSLLIPTLEHALAQRRSLTNPRETL